MPFGSQRVLLVIRDRSRHCSIRPLGSGPPTQLEHGLPPRGPDVIGDGSVDPQPKVMEDAYRRPVDRTDNSADEPGTREWREELIEDAARRFGRKLHGLEHLGPASPRDHGLPRRPKVADPVHLL